MGTVGGRVVMLVAGLIIGAGGAAVPMYQKLSTAQQQLNSTKQQLSLTKRQLSGASQQVTRLQDQAGGICEGMPTAANRQSARGVRG